jgi:hypothetical protein
LELTAEPGFMQALDARLNALMTPPAEAT